MVDKIMRRKMKNKQQIFFCLLLFTSYCYSLNKTELIDFIDPTIYATQLKILEKEFDTIHTEKHNLIAYKILTILEIQKLLKEYKLNKENIDIPLKNKALTPFSGLFTKGPNFSFLRTVLNKELLNSLSSINTTLLNKYLNKCLEYSMFIFQTSKDKDNMPYLGYINNLHFLIQEVYLLYELFPQPVLLIMNKNNLLYELKQLLDQEIKNYEASSQKKLGNLRYNDLKNKTYEQLIEAIYNATPPQEFKLNQKLESLLPDMLLWKSLF
jgi:hypothetical protein